jgi:putative membrane protein
MNFIMRIIFTSIVAFGLSYILSGVKIESGLFLFVINALIILLADRLVEGFDVDGFWWALLFSLLLSAVTAILFKEDKKEKEKS